MIGFKTRAEMAAEYGVDVKTFHVLLLRHGIVLVPGRISPRDQERIYEVLGKPKPPDSSR